MKQVRLSRIVIVLFLFLLTGLSSVRAEGRWVPIQPTADQTEIVITTIDGVTSATVRLTFPNSGYRVVWTEQALRTGNAFAAGVHVEAYTGPTLAVITTFEKTYRLGSLPAGDYSFSLVARNKVVETQHFTLP